MDRARRAFAWVDSGTDSVLEYGEKQVRAQIRGRLIGQTRPDLAAPTSLNVSGQPTVTSWLRFFCALGADASWASAEGSRGPKSQAGFLTTGG